MQRAMIIDSARLPIGKLGGMYADISPDILGSYLLKEMLKNHDLPLEEIDDVIVGNIISGGGNFARRVCLLAGLPLSVPGYTMDRQCASGLESIITASAKIKSGMANFIICGGVESTSRAPWIIEKPAKLYGKTPSILERAPLSVAPFGDPSMGEACETLAQTYKITRLEQDSYAYASQMNYQKAKKRKHFDKEVIAFNQFQEDESPRSTTTLEKLGKLPSAFSINGTLTAGNSCPLNDGASFLFIASDTFCKKYHIEPLFEIVDGLSTGIHPKEFGLGPLRATKKLLDRNNLSINELDSIELNEAFAVQALACIKLGKWPSNIINPSGGALAFGHPFGATGAILTCRLMTELSQDDSMRNGLVTMCVGGGQGTSLLLQKVSSL